MKRVITLFCYLSLIVCTSSFINGSQDPFLRKDSNSPTRSRSCEPRVEDVQPIFQASSGQSLNATLTISESIRSEKTRKSCCLKICQWFSKNRTPLIISSLSVGSLLGGGYIVGMKIVDYGIRQGNDLIQHGLDKAQDFVDTNIKKANDTAYSFAHDIYNHQVNDTYNRFENKVAEVEKKIKEVNDNIGIVEAVCAGDALLAVENLQMSNNNLKNATSQLALASQLYSNCSQPHQSPQRTFKQHHYNKGATR